MNKVLLIGNIASMENQVSNKGTEYTKFTLAVRRYVSKDEEKITDFIYCTTFVPHVINLMAEYTRVGDKIGISGSIETSRVDDKDGNSQLRFYVKVSEIELLPNKRTLENNSEDTKPIQDDGLPF